MLAPQGARGARDLAGPFGLVPAVAAEPLSQLTVTVLE